LYKKARMISPGLIHLLSAFFGLLRYERKPHPIDGLGKFLCVFFNKSNKFRMFHVTAPSLNSKTKDSITYYFVKYL